MSALVLILFLVAVVAFTWFRLWQNSPQHKDENEDGLAEDVC